MMVVVACVVCVWKVMCVWRDNVLRCRGVLVSVFWVKLVIKIVVTVVVKFEFVLFSVCGGCGVTVMFKEYVVLVILN